MPFSLSNKQPLREKERRTEKGELPEVGNWELGTGNWATEEPEPIGKLGIWEVEVKVKVEVAVVPSAKVVACFLLDFLL